MMSKDESILCSLKHYHHLEKPAPYTGFLLYEAEVDCATSPGSRRLSTSERTHISRDLPDLLIGDAPSK